MTTQSIDAAGTRTTERHLKVDADPAVSAPEATQGSRALAVRRWFLIACPVLAGLFAISGAHFDPAVGLADGRLWRLYADNPGPLQLKSLSFHWSYAFWIAPALLIAPYVRGRGAWLANVTAFIGFAGMTTLPGLLFSDWYDSAIGQLYGVKGDQAVYDLMSHTMWGINAFRLPGILGLMLALPLTAITLWRAGLVRWWSLVAAVAGMAAFIGSNVTWWGCAIATVFFGVFAVSLARATAPRTVSDRSAAH
jgi:hypothetical protein